MTKTEARSPASDSALWGVNRRPGDSPGFLFWRVTLRWQRVMHASLRALGLTHVQFVLLATTWWLTTVAGETPTQRQLADNAGTDPMMTSQVVRALEAMGLLTRAADPDDSRARRLGVTPKGAKLAQNAIAIVESADADFFTPAGDRRALLKTLHSLAD